MATLPKNGHGSSMDRENDTINNGSGNGNHVTRLETNGTRSSAHQEDVAPSNGSSNMQNSTKEKNKLPHTAWVMFISLLLDLIAFTLILPLLPSILDYYSHNDKNGFYGWLNDKINWASFRLIGSPTEFNKVLFGGIIGSWFSFLQFLASPIVGSLSDVYGRKPVLLICLIGMTIGYGFWFASREAFILFIISRTICGLCKGNVSLTTAIMTDVCQGALRGRGMALIGIGFSIGFIFGPIIGAGISIISKSSASSVIDAFFFELPAQLALLLSLANVFFVLIFFRESLPPSKRAKSIGSGLSGALNFLSPRALLSFSAVQGITANHLRLLKSVGLIYFLYLFLYSGLEFTLSFLTNVRFNYTNMQQGRMYLFSGLIMILIQGGYVRRLTPEKEPRAILNALFMIIPSFSIIGLAHNQAMLYLGLGLYAYSSAIIVTCLTTIASRCGPPEQKGTILGIIRSLGALSRALGPLFASVIFWRFGGTICYLLGSVLLTIPLIMMHFVRRNQLLIQKSQ